MNCLHEVTVGYLVQGWTHAIDFFEGDFYKQQLEKDSLSILVYVWILPRDPHEDYDCDW